MVTRKERHKKPNSKGPKLLIGTLFLSAGILGSINVAFADQDIQGMLFNWFDKQKTTSVETIEKAIMTEKEVQMQRLKEELQVEMKNAEQEMSQYTENEKEQRIAALRSYADNLIKNMKFDNNGEKNKVKKELDAVVQQAITQMDEIANQDKTPPKKDISNQNP